MEYELQAKAPGQTPFCTPTRTSRFSQGPMVSMDGSHSGKLD